MRRGAKKIRVPRWCGVHSSRPVARVRPLLDLLRSVPCGVPTCDPCSGSGLTANRKNLPNASELYPAFDVSSCSPRPALCYRPLLALPLHFREDGDCARVPDAAPTGKTLEAVKERLCFYSFHF